MRSSIPVALVLLSLCTFSFAQERQRRRQQRGYPPKLEGATVEVYKTVGDARLNMYVFTPKDHKKTDRRPAIVFFFGGGWRSGTPGQFHQHCLYLASRGMVAMAADYRVASRHQVRPPECVRDAKSAIRWIRTHAERLGVDPKRIVASGGSAGGHLAACTGVIEGLDEPDEKTEVSSRPDALVLFNPAVVLAPVKGTDFFAGARLARIKERIGTDPEKISPYHHVKKGAPPTLIFHGKADKTVAYRTVELFTEAMVKAGNKCRLVGFDGKGHGFFNYGREGGKAYTETVRIMDKFLADLGYLKGKATIDASAR